MAKQRPRPRKVPTLKKILRPLAGDSHRRASVDIHQYLRDLILSNALPPETILSQVEVADCLKVSRTPVREALRMLMEEGLVKAEPNYRCRVLGFDPRELEALYVSRIANEGIAATVTVQSMTDEDVETLAELLRQLRKDEKQHNLRRWLKNHRAFHQMLKPSGAAAGPSRCRSRSPSIDRAAGRARATPRSGCRGNTDSRCRT